MSDADSDADELAELRRQKRQQLEERLRGGSVPVHVESADHLDELLERYSVVLVDFYADWCGPCKMLEPTVEALARETTAAVAKVDVDARGELAAAYGVQSMPTLLLFDGGEVAERVVGVQEESRLRALVDRYTAA